MMKPSPATSPSSASPPPESKTSPLLHRMRWSAWGAFLFQLSAACVVLAAFFSNRQTRGGGDFSWSLLLCVLFSALCTLLQAAHLYNLIKVGTSELFIVTREWHEAALYRNVALLAVQTFVFWAAFITFFFQSMGTQYLDALFSSGGGTGSARAIIFCSMVFYLASFVTTVVLVVHHSRVLGAWDVMHLIPSRPKHWIVVLILAHLGQLILTIVVITRTVNSVCIIFFIGAALCFGYQINYSRYILMENNRLYAPNYDNDETEYNWHRRMRFFMLGSLFVFNVSFCADLIAISIQGFLKMSFWDSVHRYLTPSQVAISVLHILFFALFVLCTLVSVYLHAAVSRYVKQENDRLYNQFQQQQLLQYREQQRQQPPPQSQQQPQQPPPQQYAYQAAPGDPYAQPVGAYGAQVAPTYGSYPVPGTGYYSPANPQPQQGFP